MKHPERSGPLDRRRVPRGGRRFYDRPGRFPPILVAESNDGLRRPCVRYLERFHFDVAEAAHGEEALARIVAVPPRVVLLEWTLPAMPGTRLRQWLAQSHRTRDVRVIAITSGDEGNVLPQADAVLVKPFSLDVMLAEIRRVLRGVDSFG